MIPSYPKVWSFSSQVPVSPFDGKPAIIQEKIDGSQFSFGMTDDGQLHMRSKSTFQTPEQHDKMFNRAVESVRERLVDLPPGLIFRGEYLGKAKHNTLAYDNVPRDNIVIFDVMQRDDQGLWRWLALDAAQMCAAALDYDFVPSWEATITSADQLLEMLDRESYLGGCKIEGVVLKRYDLMVPQFQAPLFCKYVSEGFKENHRTDWKNRNPSGKDHGERLASSYTTEARWLKAVQHLRESGRLEESPRDIGPLIGEVHADVDAECAGAIKDALYAHWRKTAGRGLTRGLPEWYKERLLREAFDVPNSPSAEPVAA